MGLLCPSSPSQLATLVIGVRDSSGKMRFIAAPQVVTPNLRNRDAEMRYATKCVSVMCSHWVQNRCEWPQLLLVPELTHSKEFVEGCSIRNKCRWFSQMGAEICHHCVNIQQPISEENTEAENKTAGSVAYFDGKCSG